MQKRLREVYILAIASILSIGLISCHESLSADEMKVIDTEMPDIILERNINRSAERVEEYLQEAIESYCKHLHETTQSKIDDRNATAALFGGSMPFDMGELFGTSTNQLIANQYNKFIDFVNEKSEKANKDAEAIVEIIKSDPDILDEFNEGNSTISLSKFNQIQGLPSSISTAQFVEYKNLEQNDNNHNQWGSLLMGTLKNPHYSPLTLLCALVMEIDRLKYPQPVYAVWKEYDEEEGWEVGYDTSQAYFITFEQDGDILEFSYDPVDYFEGYIDSKNNKLKK